MYVYIYIIRCIHSISPPFSAGGNNVQSQVLKRGFQKKMTIWGEFESFCHAEYLPGGLAMFLAKKRLSKIKYGFEFPISNVDIGLF